MEDGAATTVRNYRVLIIKHLMYPLQRPRQHAGYELGTDKRTESSLNGDRKTPPETGPVKG